MQFDFCRNNHVYRQSYRDTVSLRWLDGVLFSRALIKHSCTLITRGMNMLTRIQLLRKSILCVRKVIRRVSVAH